MSRYDSRASARSTSAAVGAGAADGGWRSWAFGMRQGRRRSFLIFVAFKYSPLAVATGWFICRLGGSGCGNGYTFLPSALTVLLPLYATAIPTKKEPVSRAQKGDLVRTAEAAASHAIRCPSGALKPNSGCSQASPSMNIHSLSTSNASLLIVACSATYVAGSSRIKRYGLQRAVRLTRASALVYPQGAALYNSRPCRHSSVGRATAL